MATSIVIGRIFEFFGGLWQLARLGVVTRFRFKGPYWQWRMHTAFGRGMPSSRGELIRALLAYGIWMHRMRRMR